MIILKQFSVPCCQTSWAITIAIGAVLLNCGCQSTYSGTAESGRDRLSAAVNSESPVAYARMIKFNSPTPPLVDPTESAQGELVFAKPRFLSPQFDNKTPMTPLQVVQDLPKKSQVERHPSGPSQAEQARFEQSQAKLRQVEQSRQELARVEQAKVEQAKVEQAKHEHARIEYARREQARTNQLRSEQAKQEQTRVELARIEELQREHSSFEQWKLEQSQIQQVSFDHEPVAMAEFASSDRERLQLAPTRYESTYREPNQTQPISSRQAQGKLPPIVQPPMVQTPNFMTQAEPTRFENVRLENTRYVDTTVTQPQPEKAPSGFSKFFNFRRKSKEQSEPVVAMSPVYAAQIQAARKLEEQGNLPAAIKAYESVIQMGDRSPVSLHRLAVLYDQNGRKNGALPLYQQALTSDPDNVDLLCDIGYHWFKAGNHAEAERFYRRALQHAPRDARTNNNLAVLLAKNGQQDAAMKHFQNAGLDLTEAQHNLKTVLASN